MDAIAPNVVEPAHPTVSRASVEAWPLRWKVAAIMVLPVLLAATFGALRIQNELSAASKLSVASGNAGIVVPAVEFVDRLDGLATAAAAAAPIAEPLTQFDASAAALASLITSAEFDPTVTAALATASSTAKTLRDEIASGPMSQLRIAAQAESVATDVVSAITTATATVGDSAVRPLADRLVDVLAAQRALTTQRVLVAAPDFVDSVLLRAKAADAAGAEAAAIDRLTRLTPKGDGTALAGPPTFGAMPTPARWANRSTRRPSSPARRRRASTSIALWHNNSHPTSKPRCMPGPMRCGPRPCATPRSSWVRC